MKYEVRGWENAERHPAPAPFSESVRYAAQNLYSHARQLTVDGTLAWSEERRRTISSRVPAVARIPTQTTRPRNFRKYSKKVIFATALEIESAGLPEIGRWDRVFGNK